MKCARKTASGCLTCRFLVLRYDRIFYVVKIGIEMKSKPSFVIFSISTFFFLLRNRKQEKAIFNKKKFPTTFILKILMEGSEGRKKFSSRKLFFYFVKFIIYLDPSYFFAFIFEKVTWLEKKKFQLKLERF